MVRTAVVVALVAVLSVMAVRADGDPLAAARYRLVYDQAKRECTGIDFGLDLQGPTPIPGVVWSGDSVQFVVQPSPRLSPADRRAFAAGCRAGSTKPPAR
jgi:hypothetical protein